VPDLSKESVHAFWDSYDRRTLYRIIVSIERTEDWCLDGDPGVAKGLMALGEAIDEVKGDLDISEKDKLIRLLAVIKAGKALRVLQTLDMIKAGTASSLLMHAEKSSEGKDSEPGCPYAKVFLRRNLVFERLQLLSRVFSPQRMSLLLRALEANNE